MIRNWLRHLRYALREPDWLKHEKNECQFYSQFVPWGGLVFDIGANAGDKTFIFHLLGAKVVAVDALPDCASALVRRFAGQDVTVVESAVGEKTGTQTLYVGETSEISSLLPDWIERNPAQLSKLTTTNSISVAVTTLDNLTSQHGIPDFCKIDVEGFELQVLNGLTSALPAISLEWTGDTLDLTEKAIRRLSELGRYEFNFTYSSPMRMESRRWLVGAELLPSIDAALADRAQARWGDIVARHVGSR